MEPLDWNRCIICQQDTAEPLKCPLKSPGTSSQKHNAYTSFRCNVEQFRDIGALPVKLHFGTNETADNLASHFESWHKSCYLKFNNSKLGKAKKKRERENDESEAQESKRKKRQALDVQKCFLCETGDEAGVLHQVSTYDADTNLRTMITELNDAQLLTRIVGGDLIAVEAKYHLKCQINLRNRYRSLIRMSNQETAAETREKMNESKAFVELTSYIEKSVDSGILLFKLSEIHSMYVNRRPCNK